jgi:hypothetical protein
VQPRRPPAALRGGSPAGCRRGVEGSTNPLAGGKFDNKAHEQTERLRQSAATPLLVGFLADRLYLVLMAPALAWRE